MTIPDNPFTKYGSADLTWNQIIKLTDIQVCDHWKGLEKARAAAGSANDWASWDTLREACRTMAVYLAHKFDARVRGEMKQ